MDKTLVVLNPHAANGRVQDLWQALRPRLETAFGDVEGAFTESVEDVLPVVRQAYLAGVRRVLAMGGDGTNHSVVNAVIAVQAEFPDDEHIAYGNIPVGTGRDWTRTLGTPLEPRAAIEHLATATPHKIDVGEITVDDTAPEIFLNTSSIGLGGCVSSAVNALDKRYPWTFMLQTLRCIFTYRPQAVSVVVDGELLFEGKTFITMVTNGAIFGHGMKIAPPARIDDGHLDVLAIETVSRLQLIGLFAQVYRGAHLRHPLVMHRPTYETTITCQQGVLTVELDGENRTGKQLRFRVLAQSLTVLR